MAAPPSVLVVGSINVDLVIHADRLPAPGETVAGGRLERAGGGKGANQAVAAARAGAAVALVGAVGDDDLGTDALAALRAEGVDVGAVARLGGVATGVALIVVDRDGRNQIAVASGANHEVSAEHVRAARGSAPGCVLTSFELLDEPVLAAARIARDAGCPLLVDPAPARPLEARLRELRPILTPNHPEAAELTGEQDPDAAARALTAQTGAAVVVSSQHCAAGVEPSHPSDTVAAGDPVHGRRGAVAGARAGAWLVVLWTAVVGVRSRGRRARCLRQRRHLGGVGPGAARRSGGRRGAP